MICFINKFPFTLIFNIQLDFVQKSRRAKAAKKAKADKRPKADRKRKR